ncbi:MAG: fused response regulator/phosphatase [Holophagaceae bacterium]|nr:fused response regulator/phosphatase [Holophagaceae bacterium]
MSKGVVLVVDDESPIRDILSFYLKRADYQVLLAENGVRGLEEMGKLQPDLIISDLRMPEMAGDDFCRHVKSNTATKDIYFMLVSALDGSMSKIGGLNIGADDMISKPFHAQEVMAKVDSAFRIIAMQKEIKRQNVVLREFQDRVNNEMELASRLQMGLLPALPGIAPGILYTHRYLPAEGIGGDIYAITPLPDGSTALMIADVSGHGVTAALISSMVKTSFESQLRLSQDPHAWAVGMNQDLSRNTLAEQFATAFLAHLDPATSQMAYVVAGHPAPFMISCSGGGKPEQLSGKGFMLGIDADLPFSSQCAPFNVGDRLVLFTDGLEEVEREDRTYLGEEGLMEFCLDLPADAEDAAMHLVNQVQAYNGPATFSDDVTLVVVDRVN